MIALSISNAWHKLQTYCIKILKWVHTGPCVPEYWKSLEHLQELPCARNRCICRRYPDDQAPRALLYLQTRIPGYIEVCRYDGGILNLYIYGIPEEEQQALQESIFAIEKELYPNNERTFMTFIHTREETWTYCPHKYELMLAWEAEMKQIKQMEAHK